MAIGRSASKMHGFYLAIATLAFGILIETVFGEWTALTGGHMGFAVPVLKLFGMSLTEVWQQYYVDLVLRCRHLGRVQPVSVADRAVVSSPFAIRNFRPAASVSMSSGSRSRRLASAPRSPASPARLLAHHLTYLAPEVFGVLESLKLMLMIVVGGLGSDSRCDPRRHIHLVLPVALSFLKDVLPPLDRADGRPRTPTVRPDHRARHRLRTAGLYGRWMKIALFLRDVSLLPQVVLCRQKSYLKTERMR